jgi:hypothetical protein
MSPEVSIEPLGLIWVHRLSEFDRHLFLAKDPYGPSDRLRDHGMALDGGVYHVVCAMSSYLLVSAEREGPLCTVLAWPKRCARSSAAVVRANA